MPQSQTGITLEDVLTSVRDSVIVTDLNGIVTVWNQGATRLFGHSADEMIGQPVANRLPEPQRSAALEWIRRIALDSAEFDGEWQDVRKDGSPIWIEANTRLLRDSSGTPIGIMGVSRDISERKRLEAQRDELLSAEQHARAQAQAANRSKDQFLAVLSHELRTPLTPVVMTLAAMSHHPDLPPDLRNDINVVRRNIELEAHIIDDLLDVSRIANGKLRINPQPTSAHPLLINVVEMCSADGAAARRIACHLEARDDTFNGDTTRLQQVFWNLLKNAVKFTPPAAAIVVRTSNPSANRLRVEVSDQGVGIAPDLLPTIFDAFSQGDQATTRRFGGLGLGLAICKSIVDMHGGTIQAHSDGENRGATFTVELPLSVAIPRAEMPPTPDAIDRARAGVRILLVDDHSETVNVLKRLLSSKGYSVNTANSIRSALDLVSARHFDLVISDLGLPDGTGWDLMRELRSHADLPGIALSGYGMEDDLEKSRDAGFVEHVIKPANIDSLQEVIQRVIGRPPPVRA
jgi:PAS domain S-box-containing protein